MNGNGHAHENGNGTMEKGTMAVKVRTTQGNACGAILADPKEGLP